MGALAELLAAALRAWRKTVSTAEGPMRGLELMADLAGDATLKQYHLFYSTRADLLRRVGQLQAAVQDYREALRLVGNEPERRYLQRRLHELLS